mgnify:CR=1 FL=1
MAKTSRLTLDQLHKQLTEGEIKEVPLILKCDVQGSQEALVHALTRLATDEVKVTVVHAGVGGITESDVILAHASGAAVIVANHVSFVDALVLMARGDVGPFGVATLVLVLMLDAGALVSLLGAGGMVVLTTHLEVAFSAQVIVVELGGRTPRA